MNISHVQELWYRYETRTYANWDESPRHPGENVKLYEVTFRVLRHTPKGVWLQQCFRVKVVPILGESPGTHQDFSVKPRFVLLSARKRYACPTKREALYSFVRRSKRRIHLLQGQVADTQVALNKAQNLLTSKYNQLAILEGSNDQALR